MIAKFDQCVERLYGAIGAADVDEFLAILSDAVALAQKSNGTSAQVLASLAKLLMEQSPSHEKELAREEAIQASRWRRKQAVLNEQPHWRQAAAVEEVKPEAEPSPEQLAIESADDSAFERQALDA